MLCCVLPEIQIRSHACKASSTTEMYSSPNYLFIACPSSLPEIRSHMRLNLPSYLYLQEFGWS